MSKEIIYVEEHPFREREIAATPYAYTNSQTILNIARMFGEGDISEHLGKGSSQIMCYTTDGEWNPFIEVLDRTGLEYEVRANNTGDWSYSGCHKMDQGLV